MKYFHGCVIDAQKCITMIKKKFILDTSDLWEPIITIG